jgi:hypothetical protein
MSVEFSVYMVFRMRPILLTTVFMPFSIEVSRDAVSSALILKENSIVIKVMDL